ncbi:Uncharacterised protein [Legionella israelensis]|uniref:Uncharacterized protein n=1 Tax=Legionella israelensis TaxID=454 RepID=A0A0W0VY46_9GAMM|nr:hypothetical protein Lisr_1303 [Legionella israelensis]SCY52284.1 hypothetical protein SAMN02746069_02741 [Legionella israelensis DSM 19235]STX60446.1 Uncharacterised protein [Legionella israelensis]
MTNSKVIYKMMIILPNNADRDEVIFFRKYFYNHTAIELMRQIYCTTDSASRKSGR